MTLQGQSFRIGVLIAACLATTAAAGVSCTPAELRAMVARGQYPAQGSLADEQVNEMPFEQCLHVMESHMDAIRPQYPVLTIADTAVLKTMKAWLNDGAVVVTCSKLDGKMVLTRAPYR